MTMPPTSASPLRLTGAQAHAATVAATAARVVPAPRRAARPPRTLPAVLAFAALLATAAALTAAPASAATCTVRFAVTGPVTLGALDWSVDYSAAPGGFAGSGSGVSCSGAGTGSAFTFADHDAQRVLDGGLLSFGGFATPGNLASCTFDATATPVAADFVVSVQGASDVDANPVDPAPVVSVASIDCGAVPTTTTTTSTTTTTTLPTGTCRHWIVTARATAGTAGLSSLQLVLDYSAAGGAIDGSGATPVCTSGVAGALVSLQDDEAKKQLQMALISLAAVPVPGDLVSCAFTTATTTAPARADFGVQVLDATTTDDLPATVTIGVQVRPDRTAQGCAGTCGDGEVVAPEQCDDGNASNDDACLANCTTATCGDGYVRSAVEACDDGNASNTDACLSNCTAARCGDGIVHAGVETCDDGNASSTDACLGNCTAARCGDGYVRAGVEECDDGNATDGDGCSGGCLVPPRCGDATGDGTVKTSDALRILQRAVGMDVECPDWLCDTSGDGKVTTADSLKALYVSVGRSTTLACAATPKALVLRLMSPVLLGSVNLDVGYANALAEIAGTGAGAQCTGLGTETVASFMDNDGSRVLQASIASAAGIQGPRSLARCTLAASGVVKPLVLPVAVGSASAPGGGPLSGVQVRAVPY